MGDIRGVDVSSYQGTIDWKKAKADGVKFAVIKIIRKDLTADKKFEENWKGCTDAGVDILGVYNYSYATSVAKAKTDAAKVVATLKGRKTCVWMDVEDSCQKNLGKTLIDIINAYAKVITDAGLDFGVYTGYSFYNTYIKPYGALPYKLWIARYGTNNGSFVESNRPKFDNVVAWQFTSKAHVAGISGDCDMNLYWGKVESPAAAPVNTYKEPLLTMKVGSKGDGVKWVQWHLVRLGYLAEKTAKGNSNIDGVFGTGTEAAVKAFQKKAFPNAPKEWDGKVGSKTRAAMKGEK